MVQTQQTDSLIEEKSTQWFIQEHCRTALDKGAALGKELVNICESINQNLQTSVTQVKDQAILKKYEALAAKMISYDKGIWQIFHQFVIQQQKIPEYDSRPNGKSCGTNKQKFFKEQQP